MASERGDAMNDLLKALAWRDLVLEVLPIDAELDRQVTAKIAAYHAKQPTRKLRTK